MDIDEYKTCPFDRSHRILKSRMQCHLVICKANHLEDKFVRCIYNSTHLLQSTEILSHLEICKDRYKFDCFVYTPEDCDRNKYPVNNTISVIDDEETTWDNLNLPTYNPKEYCFSNLIIQRLDCASAGDRKKFREEERRRFQQLKNEGKHYPIEQIEHKDTMKCRHPSQKPLCLAAPIDPKLILKKMKEFVLKEKKTEDVPTTNKMIGNEMIYKI